MAKMPAKPPVPKMREAPVKAPPADEMIPSNAGRQAQSSDNENKYQ